ncbi:esterase family protein [Dysgonomonas sp. 511]|uniref:alpha/beta hydrolase n=1 Tax=Dysgonomonas sp. 511 TaxID=2302930 RepID=UPI0013D74489|nr:alpha/beta hydrolase family protein [Dysgonomonas sp. 511]NDV80245.1 esterase family protein [Dysgonomonas sp. 511]
MKKLCFSVIIFLITVSVFAQSQEAQSRMETGTFYSNVLKADRDYNIFLPKSYSTDTNKKYPVLYLLHGLMDTNRGWTERGHVKDVLDQLIASGEACEMIVVTPNAGGDINAGVWNGYFDMPGWKYETFFFSEFLPYIEKSYRAIGDKQHRAIAGLSMGGGGATAYGQKHSDLFGSVYAMSALMSRPAVEKPDGDSNDKRYLLNKSVYENDCVKYVEESDDTRKNELRSIRWFVDCGDDDFLFDSNIRFVQAMHKAGIPLEFRVRNGGHAWEYWHSALYVCLPYVSRNFGKN